MEWDKVGAVVVPLDLDEPDESGLKLALQATDANQVHVVYVLPELEPSLLTQIGPATRRTHADASLRTWLAERAFPEALRTHVLIGSAATEITGVARSVSADLVILQSRGRRGIARALMGSVAERVARLAPCAVLVVKAPPKP